MPEAERGPEDGPAVDVWLTHLAQPEAVVDALVPLLSPAERARASRLHSPSHRRRYIVAHGSLRRILACYTGHAPWRIRFELGPQGRPSLPTAAGGAKWDFSLSHSYEIAAIGVTRPGPIGIDVEWIDAHRRIDLLAAKILPPIEVERLLILPASRRIVEFHRAWTRFEAAAKASGNGIAAAAAAREGRLLSPWHFTEFCARGYVGALFLPRLPRRIIWRRWRPDGCDTLSEGGLDSRVSLPASLCFEGVHGGVETGDNPRRLLAF